MTKTLFEEVIPYRTRVFQQLFRHNILYHLALDIVVAYQYTESGHLHSHIHYTLYNVRSKSIHTSAVVLNYDMLFGMISLYGVLVAKRCDNHMLLTKDDLSFSIISIGNI